MDPPSAGQHAIDTRNHPLLPGSSTQTRIATDKIPEAPVNVIKAVAYLLEEATVAEYADKIAAQLNKLTVTAHSDPTVNSTTTHIEQALNAINDTKRTAAESGL
jgi:hypothetical protein